MRFDGLQGPSDKVGDRIYVGPGQACGMNFTNGVWAVEYERGPLPTRGASVVWESR